MAYRVSFLYNLSGQGWSINLYYQATLTLPTDGTLPPPVKSLGDALWAITANPVNWVGTRVADIDNPRRTIVVAGNNVQAPGNTPPDYVTNAALAIVKGVGNVGTRQFWLRGVRDEDIFYDDKLNIFDFGANLRGKWSTVRGILLGDSWCLRTVNPGGIKNGAKPITGVSNNAGGNQTILIPNAFAPAVTDTIIVGGFKKPMSFLNGTYQPGTGWSPGPTGNVLINNKQVTPSMIVNYPGTASIRTATKTLTRIGSANLEFVRERRTGRAFFVPAGRRSHR